MFKVGDIVWCSKLGEEGVIVSVDGYEPYSVLVEFNIHRHVHYTQDGKLNWRNFKGSLVNKSTKSIMKEETKSINSGVVNKYNITKIHDIGFMIEFENGSIIYQSNKGDVIDITNLNQKNLKGLI